MEGHTPFLRLAGLAALLLAAAMLMFSCTGGTEGDNTSDNTDAGQILFLSHDHYS